MRAEENLRPATYPSYTVDDWEHWDGKWELMDGFPWMWNPATMEIQTLLGERLDQLFKLAFQGNPNFEIKRGGTYDYNDLLALGTDLAILRLPLSNPIWQLQNAVLVADVLIGNPEFKLPRPKLEVYAALQIPYSLLIHPTEEWVRVQTLEDGDWKIAYEGRDGTFEFDIEGCKAKVDFAEIWA
jgi:hypothetical protein